jgi:putative peptidoglycan lipid II flippase
VIKRLLNSTTQSITGAAIILGSASFLSRIMGVIRDRMFAHLFGAGNVLDAYYAAFRIPDLVYNLLIVGALSAGFIPVFMELLEKDKKQAWRVTNSILNILSILLILVCAILFVYTEALTDILVPGFSSEQLALTVTLTRIMFLSPILLGISSLVSGVIQSFKSFFIYALTPIMYNLGIIIGAWFLVPLFGPKGLAYGVILGALLHLIIQLPKLLNHGFLYMPIIEWRNPSVRRIGALMIPRTLGLATNHLMLIAVTAIASTLAVGSITVFNFANNLQFFAVGVVGVSFAVAAFPTFSQFAARGEIELLVTHLGKTVRQILFFVLPLTLIFLLLRAQIVRVVLGSGAFGWEATIATADTLAFFSLSLFAQASIPLLVRAFYAIQDTWTPFLTSLIATFATIAGALYYKDIYGVAGIALAFSLAMILQLIILWIVLRAKIGTLHEGKLIQSLQIMSVASIAMAVTLQLIKIPLAGIVDMTRFWGILTQGFVAGIAGLLIYAGVCYVLKLEEMHTFKNSMQRRFLKLENKQFHVEDVMERD